ncbi:cytosolic phospholipase A2-like [Crassostrea virginica]|uniref:Phospholipase A2 n=1 Tax=Crassostrea virginica TaxID=6565 RepID=A0A8B8DKB8_CRAVI|nr:cytosolic phospholipase A2-like [Crassostrea virginica]XP_022328611.1 cytosolic phospholipase A2-like [Crassostrea virginica]XP_022328612.1 cytosolic phospholipase A2-like [Crassostrea virginica]XP_022328613.1 cytosolic phospholipase A2-like [Crassostrea virginica]XP_022328614.1 cytosolic phospholipase A2-like [Crassostrea virginica]
MNNNTFDPFQIFEVTHDPCAVLYIRVVRGNKITKGYYKDMLDTPDPYVVLMVEGAPNCYQRTHCIDNNINPEWNETFKFYLNPKIPTTVEVTLMDANYTYDEMLGEPQKILLHYLPSTKEERTLKFNGTSEVVIQMWAHHGCEPQLRFSLALCSEERAFAERRRKKVFEAMKEILGEDAPTKERDVPNIGVIGSGGGFRAMTAYSGVFSALVDSHILDMTTYAGGLSGSAWYLSQLYSHPDWPNKTPKELQEELGRNIENSPFWLLNPQSLCTYVSRIVKKRQEGQPVSFTDFFGCLVGDTILKNRLESKLTDQQDILKKADVPMPLFTCLHVKKNVSAEVFHEWMEFTPYEIGLPKYGTFMKTQLFGSKFFMGQLVKQYEEPPLHFLQGVWGSAFCIQISRLLRDDKKVTCEQDISEDVEQERNEMAKELMQDLSLQSEEESDTSESDSEDNELDKKPKKNKKPKEALRINKREKTTSKKSFWKDMFKNVYQSTRLLKSIEGRAAKVHSFMRGLSMSTCYPFSPFSDASSPGFDDLDASYSGANPFSKIFEMYPTTMKKLYVVDGGLTFNSPYPLVLRPQREVDLILSFDFSARPSDTALPFKEIMLAEQWANLNKVPFPKINPKIVDVEGRKECYVFENLEDPKCPIVLHFVLANIKFRDEIKPGVPRVTEEEKEFADFDLFDDPQRPYSTFNFKYPKKSFERLTKLTEYNTLLYKDLILEKIKQCVKRRQKYYPEIKRPIKLGDIKKLSLNRENSVNLEHYLGSIDEELD